MKLVRRLLPLALAACLAAGPAGAQQSESLDDVDRGESVSPDAVPTASGDTPAPVDEPGTEDVVDSEAPDSSGTSESLDGADTGATETPDAVDAADAQAIASGAPSPPLGPTPPIVDGNFEDQAARAEDRVARARANVDYWDRAHADMIRRNFPVGAEREALLRSQAQAHADLTSATSYAAEIAARAAAAGRPID